MYNLLPSRRDYLLFLVLLVGAILPATVQAEDPFASEISGLPPLDAAQGFSELGGISGGVAGGLGLAVFQSCLDENGIAGIVICPATLIFTGVLGLGLAVGSVTESVAESIGIDLNLNPF